MARTLAPANTNMFASSRSPLIAAQCSAVMPSPCAALTSAADFNSALTAALSPFMAASATGAVAALLGEIGVPQEVMRGIAVVSRAAGLVGHIREEQTDPSARYLWELASESIPYDGA